MKPFIKSLYVRELQVQAYFALTAMNSVDQMVLALEAAGPSVSNKPDKRVFEAFRQVHSCLTHAANISKLFWPEVSSSIPKDPVKRELRASTIARGEYLRELYSIESDNALSDRGPRNDLDHFDERLDAFIIEYEASRAVNPDVRMADLFLGEAPTSADGQPIQYVLRRYDPSIGIKFHFLQKIYDLVAIGVAIDDIYKKSTAILTELS